MKRFYQCDKCSRRFDNRREAEACENRHRLEAIPEYLNKAKVWWQEQLGEGYTRYMEGTILKNRLDHHWPAYLVEMDDGERRWISQENVRRGEAERKEA